MGLRTALVQGAVYWVSGAGAWLETKEGRYITGYRTEAVRDAGRGWTDTAHEADMRRLRKEQLKADIEEGDWHDYDDE